METKAVTVTQASLTAEQREARAAEARRKLTEARDAVEQARAARDKDVADFLSEISETYFYNGTFIPEKFRAAETGGFEIELRQELHDVLLSVKKAAERGDKASADDAADLCRLDESLRSISEHVSDLQRLVAATIEVHTVPQDRHYTDPGDSRQTLTHESYPNEM